MQATQHAESQAISRNCRKLLILHYGWQELAVSTVRPLQHLSAENKPKLRYGGRSDARNSTERVTETTGTEIRSANERQYGESCAVAARFSRVTRMDPLSSV